MNFRILLVEDEIRLTNALEQILDVGIMCYLLECMRNISIVLTLIYRENKFYKKGINIVSGSLQGANRKILHSIMNGIGRGNYAFGEVELQKAVLFFNLKKRKTMDSADFCQGVFSNGY